jgi:hypothetical protein
VQGSLGAAIDTGKLNLDSSGAYTLARQTAANSHVNFATADYVLHVDDHSNPIWEVSLRRENGEPAGRIFIGTNHGTVTRTEGMFAGAPMNAVVEDHREGDVEDEEHSGDNPIMRSVRQTFYRAREQAQETFKRVRHNFADYIRGND